MVIKGPLFSSLLDHHPLPASSSRRINSTSV